VKLATCIHPIPWVGIRACYISWWFGVEHRNNHLYIFQHLYICCSIRVDPCKVFTRNWDILPDVHLFCLGPRWCLCNLQICKQLLCGVSHVNMQGCYSRLAL
jgi:hypothetical protein